MRVHLIMLCLGATSLLCCANNKVYVPGESYSAAEVQTVNDKRESDLRTRAVFEMRCEELELTCLETQVDGFCVASGVDGCGQRATYLLVQTAFGRMQWVLDAANESKVAAPEVQ